MAIQAAERIDMAEAIASMNVLLGALGRMYMHYANTVIEMAGQPGEMTVRHHLRQFGHFRGTEMREAHHAMGKPIDMASITCFWDNASTYVIEDDMEAGKYTPSDSSFDVHFCPASLAWKEAGFHRWGHVYCDEFHQACASTYHPDGNVVIPINMMKGDDHCAFRWVMPADARVIENTPPTPLGEKLAAYYRADSPGRAVYDALIRTSRLIAGRYWTMARALYALHPEDRAEVVIRRFLHSWAEQRGHVCRQRQIDRGKPLTEPHLLAGLDFAPDYVWDFSIGSTHGDASLAIDWTPMDDAWRDLQAGRLAEIFWDESLPAFIAAYAPGADISLSTPWSAAIPSVPMSA